MSRPRWIVLPIVTLLASACGKRVPQAANVAPGTPHVTWVLMYGDRDNADREFACQSDPHTDCVLPASRPDDQVFADLHLYYHGAGGETRYEGTTSIGFLQGGSQAHTTPTNITVRKNEPMTSSSVTGIVTSEAGSYAVRLALTATVADASQTAPVDQVIDVAVR